MGLNLIFWKLIDRIALPCSRDEYLEQARDPTNHFLIRTELTETIWVSTIFLGIDHNHGTEGEPLLFETMAFDDDEAIGQWRYSTYADAEEGHERACTALRAQLAKVESETNEHIEKAAEGKE